MIVASYLHVTELVFVENARDIQYFSQQYLN